MSNRPFLMYLKVVQQDMVDKEIDIDVCGKVNSGCLIAAKSVHKVVHRECGKHPAHPCGPALGNAFTLAFVGGGVAIPALFTS